MGASLGPSKLRVGNSVVKKSVECCVQLSSAREAEKRWRFSSVEGIADRQFCTRVGEGRI
jgi:hypothetical protein